jgi:hypothetical protein
MFRNEIREHLVLSIILSVVLSLPVNLYLLLIYILSYLRPSPSSTLKVATYRQE